MKKTTITAGDKVRSNGKYADIQRKFGDTVQTVKHVGKIASCPFPMVWLECGGGGFMADGFEVVIEEAKQEVTERMSMSPQAILPTRYQCHESVGSPQKPDEDNSCTGFPAPAGK